MKTWLHILRLLMIMALVSSPAVGWPASSHFGDDGIDACDDQWDGAGSAFFQLEDDEDYSPPSEEEVFCGHFMVAERFSEEMEGGEVSPILPLVSNPAIRLAEPVSFAYKMIISSEHIPHSINPEVAQHPPKIL